MVWFLPATYKFLIIFSLPKFEPPPGGERESKRIIKSDKEVTLHLQPWRRLARFILPRGQSGDLGALCYSNLSSSCCCVLEETTNREIWIPWTDDGPPLPCYPVSYLTLPTFFLSRQATEWREKHRVLKCNLSSFVPLEKTTTLCRL